jgi:hypothetical protein
MVYKKNIGDLYWFGPRNALRPVGEESSVLSCTKVLVVGVTSGCERGRSSQVSRREWRKWVCATLLVSKRVSCSYLVLCCYGGSLGLSLVGLGCVRGSFWNDPCMLLL